MREMARNSTPQTSTEENVYSSVYRVLLGGMLISSALYAIGIISALLHPIYFPLTEKWVLSHYNVSVVIHGLADLDPFSYMMVATVLLILTPVARVVTSIYAFMVDHDDKYVVITSVVLLIMIATAVAGVLGLR